MPRTLISDDGVIRRYRVTNSGGQVIGVDEELIPTAEDANADTLRQRALAALAQNTTDQADNATYLLLNTPTNVQVAAQVRALTRQSTLHARELSAVIRLVLGRLDSTDGT